MSKHFCHAIGCKTEVLPRLLMCGRHWRMVSKRSQDEVWRYYRNGQEIDKRPSREYLAAARQATTEVARKESNKPPEAHQPSLWPTETTPTGKPEDYHHERNS